MAALLVDFYGTVVYEDDAARAAICQQIADSVGVTAAEVARLWWKGFAQTCASCWGGAFQTQRDVLLSSLAAVLAHLGCDEDPAQLTEPQFRYWRQPTLFADAAEFLARVDLPTCVVSNIDRADLDAAIGYHGLAFDHVVTSEDVGSYKPRPEAFQRGLDHLGVAPEEVLHIGDSLSADVAGANHLGLAVAWINRTGRQRPVEVSLWAEVADLVQLAGLLDA